MTNLLLDLTVLILVSPVLLLVTFEFIRNTTSGGRALWRTIVWTVGAGALVKTVLAPRVITYDEQYLDLAASATANETWRLFDRALSAWVLYLVLVVFLTRILPHRKRRLTANHRGSDLFLGACALTVGPLLSSIFGTVPIFQVGLLYAPLIFIAAYLLPPVPFEWYVKELKHVLLLYLHGSLLAALVIPDWAMDMGYSAGMIPGLNVRLYGVAPHPNSLGPLALFYLILDRLSPGIGSMRWFNQLAALAVLVLSQSKTAWVAAIIVVVLTIPVDAMTKRARVLRVSAAVVSSLGMTVLTFLGAQSLGIDQSQALLSGTGRTRLWEATLDLWRNNPWFGYGSSLWSLDHRMSYGVEFLWAGHAHNQFVQTLGETGLFGAAGLVLYLLIIVRSGVKSNRETRGISLGIITVVLVRSWTEVPLRNLAVDPDLFMHFILFSLLMVACRQQWASSSVETPESLPDTVSPV